MLLFVWALPPEGSKGVSDLVMMGGCVAQHRPEGFTFYKVVTSLNVATFFCKKKNVTICNGLK